MHHLKAYFLTAVLTAGCLLSARAQESVETSEAPASRREIGFGTNIILGPVFNSGSTPLDLMYRWGNDDRLYRIGASLVYHNATNYGDNLNQKSFNDFYRADVFLGREWRAAVAKRWLVNYGGDIVFNSSRQNYRHESTYDESEEITRLSIGKNRSMRIGGGLRPFIGVMFKINDRLLLGTEASFFANIQKTSSSSEGYTLINGVRNDTYHNYEREESDFDIHIRTQPASNIFVYYRF